MHKVVHCAEMSDIDEEEAEEEVGPNLGVSFFTMTVRLIVLFNKHFIN